MIQMHLKNYCEKKTKKPNKIELLYHGAMTMNEEKL